MYTNKIKYYTFNYLWFHSLNPISLRLEAEIDQIETKRTIERINKIKRWFFAKINKIDKPLARLTRGQRESIKINKIRKESGEIMTETREFKKSSDPTTKAYTQQSCKIRRKWMNY